MKKASKKWDAEHYRNISFSLPKGLVAEFREAVALDKSTSQAAIIRAAMERYIRVRRREVKGRDV